MKTLLLIVFKVVEVALIIAAYFPLCWIGYKIEYLTEGGNMHAMYNPFSLFYTFLLILSIILIGMLFVLSITYIIPWWIALNRKWIDKLLK